jgi:hypothetical protein
VTHSFRSLLLALFACCAAACADPGCMRQSECKDNYECKSSRCVPIVAAAGVSGRATAGQAAAAAFNHAGAFAAVAGFRAPADAGTGNGTAGKISDLPGHTGTTTTSDAGTSNTGTPDAGTSDTTGGGAGTM